MSGPSGFATRKSLPSGLDNSPAIRRSALIRPDFKRRSGISAVYYFATTRSTNTAAKELLSTGAPDRSLIVASRQTAGRGRNQNRWWSGRGSLTFSILLRPSGAVFAPPNPVPISLVAGLAVVSAIRRMNPGCPVGVKWPNDIFSEDLRKIGGILVESTIRRAKLHSAIVGIGLNVNASMIRAPAEIRNRATSLHALTGHRWNEVGLLGEILHEFFKAERRFHARGFSGFSREWQEADVIDAGRSVSLESDRQTTDGFYEGISQDGAIRMRLRSGKVAVFYSGTLIPR